MRAINWFTDLLLYTSIFTACCAVSLCMATERLINGASPSIINPLHTLVFGSTLLVYNTPRIIKRARDQPGLERYYRPAYFLFFISGLLLMAAGLHNQPWSMLEASGVLGVFAFAYFLPILPFKTKKRLRDFGWLKILVLTGVWTVATSLLPMIYWKKELAAYPLEAAIRFVFIFAICVVFDIRDMRADRSNNIQTLPNKVGLENSYLLIRFSLLLFAILSIAQYVRFPQGLRLGGALCTAAVAWGLASYLRRNASDRAYLLLADGLMLLYAVLVLIPYPL